MINILIVASDDQPSFYKKYLQAIDISIVHATGSLDDVDNYIKQVQVILLDVGMADAKRFISVLKQKRVPILAIVDSAPTGFTVMEWGATDMQMRLVDQQPAYFCKMIMIKIRTVAKKVGGQAPRTLKRTNTGKFEKIIAIGSSTGGTETVEGILRKLPEDMPPILVVQHMPPIFTRMYAERLNGICGLTVWEARNNDPLRRGLVLIAPGDQHMVLAKDDSGLIVKCIGGERVCNQRPAVDVLYDSMVSVLGNNCQNCLGVILTGMGSDGAKGMLALRNLGAMTIGQNEESSVVYGMPRAAYEMGAVVRQLHLDDIAPAIINFSMGR